MTGAGNDPALTRRLSVLCERFREIGHERMRDLPVYNAAVDVEAVGFRPFYSGWIGVLVTPWFMNLVLLPGEWEEWEVDKIGTKRTYGLPSGPAEFVVGGDEIAGAFDTKPIRSDVKGFASQEEARAVAVDALEAALGDPVQQQRAAVSGKHGPKGGSKPKPAQEPPKFKKKLGRRELLRGRLLSRGEG